MVQIISDSSTLYSSSEAREIGLITCPLNVSINNQVYREYDDIDSQAFIDLVRAGHLPKTSQPSVGEKVEAYNAVSSEDEIIDLTMADGLSGTYQSALCAKDMAENNHRIYVINTQTLCATHRYIVNKAVAMAKNGCDVKTIMNKIGIAIQDGGSFLIPADFDFLKRGGRLNSVAATIGGLIKIVPLMTLSEDRKSIAKFSIQKTIGKATDKIIEYFQEKNIDENYYIAVSHADNLETATKVKARLEEALNTAIDLFDLSPAFIAQGGPSSVAIQWCRKIDY